MPDKILYVSPGMLQPSWTGYSAECDFASGRPMCSVLRTASAVHRTRLRITITINAPTTKKISRRLRRYGSLSYDYHLSDVTKITCLYTSLRVRASSNRLENKIHKIGFETLYVTWVTWWKNDRKRTENAPKMHRKVTKMDMQREINMVLFADDHPLRAIYQL